MFGRKKDQEMALEDLPIAPYPEYVNPQKAVKQAQPMVANMLGTRPRATGDLFKMEKVTQGKNDFICMSLMVLQKDAINFKVGKTLLVQ